MISAAPARAEAATRRIASQVPITPCSECVQRELHDVDDQEGNPENHTVTAERIRDRQRGDKHRRHRDPDRPPDGTHTGIDSIPIGRSHRGGACHAIAGLRRTQPPGGAAQPLSSL